MGEIESQNAEEISRRLLSYDKLKILIDLDKRGSVLPEKRVADDNVVEGVTAVSVRNTVELAFDEGANKSNSKLVGVKFYTDLKEDTVWEQENKLTPQQSFMVRSLQRMTGDHEFGIDLKTKDNTVVRVG